MKHRRWNDTNGGTQFWDHNNQRIATKEGQSDKDLIRNPNHARHEDVLLALCEIVSELVEIVEEYDSYPQRDNTHKNTQLYP